MLAKSEQPLAGCKEIVVRAARCKLDLKIAVSDSRRYAKLIYEGMQQFEFK